MECASDDWERWFARAGIGKVVPASRLVYSHGSLAIEATIRGEGVVPGRSILIADDLAAGRLVELFPHICLKAERGYEPVCRNGGAKDAKVRAGTWYG